MSAPDTYSVHDPDDERWHRARRVTDWEVGLSFSNQWHGFLPRRKGFSNYKMLTWGWFIFSVAWNQLR